jgi:hypothetical protein
LAGDWVSLQNHPRASQKVRKEWEEVTSMDFITLLLDLIVLILISFL